MKVLGVVVIAWIILSVIVLAGEGILDPFTLIFGILVTIVAADQITLRSK